MLNEHYNFHSNNECPDKISSPLLALFRIKNGECNSKWSKKKKQRNSQSTYPEKKLPRSGRETGREEGIGSCTLLGNNGWAKMTVETENLRTRREFRTNPDNISNSKGALTFDEIMPCEDQRICEVQTNINTLSGVKSIWTAEIHRQLWRIYFLFQYFNRRKRNAGEFNGVPTLSLGPHLSLY